jgi:hypothetical protein
MKIKYLTKNTGRFSLQIMALDREKNTRRQKWYC